MERYQYIYDIVSTYRSLKKDILYPFDPQKIEHFKLKENEILSKRKKLKELKAELEKLTREDIKQYKQNLINSISEALKLTSNNKLGYPLSRNQGLIIPNYVYGKVLGIIESAMNAVVGFAYPEFYFEKDGDFDSSDLRRLLEEFHDNLSKKDFSSIFELEKFYEDYAHKIKDLWAKENEEHPQSRLH